MLATRPWSMRVFSVSGMRSGWPLGLVLLTACTFSATQTGPFSGPGNRDCSECPEMVIVPAGEFQMGAPEGP